MKHHPFIRKLRRNWLFTGALVFLVGVVLVAIFAPWIVPHNPNLQSLSLRLRPPAFVEGGSWEHLLGTDQLGRDLLSRIIMGSRVSLLIGLSTVFVGVIVGGTIGLLTGYFEGWLDAVFMRLADIQLAFPYILLTLAVLAVLGPGLNIVIFVLGIASWPAYARIIRGAVLSVKQREFVASAVALGANTSRIVFRHVLPNVLAPLLVVATLQISQMMMAEAALSFLGAGVPITTPTWGGMLNEGQRYIFNAWWLTIFPGVALTLVVIAFNFVGDGVDEVVG